MKVCDVVCNSVWWDPRVRKQIIEYQKNGCDVCCVGVKDYLYDEEQIARIPCETNVVKIPEKYDKKQKRLTMKLIRERLRIVGMRRAIVDAKPDVIHANDLDALLVAFPVFRKLKCRLIYDSHEICTEDQSTKRRYGFALPLIRKYERYMICRVGRMVCVSNAAADYFVQKYGVDKPMVVTNCALASDIIVGDVEKNEGFEVLNHGSFYNGRGYDTMIETAPLLKAYPEIKLALRGFGKIEKQLHDRAEELNATNVVFYPKVLVKELIPMAARSKVGIAITEPININFRVSVSNKLFEYAAAGLPVIMSDIPEHRYLNDKYNFGIILPNDSPEELAKAIVKLYSDRTLYDACKENAIKMSLELNWENEFAKLIEVERKLLAL